MKRKYVDILTKEELNHLQQQADELMEENRKLREDNEHLSSLIHKDNKLMKALLTAATAINDTVVPEENMEKRREMTERILAQLNEEAGDRADFLRNYEHSGRTLPTTGIDRIDTMISYYDQKTFAEGIQYDVMIDPRFSEVIEGKIAVEDLSTLLADLLENATIAVKPQEQKRILLTLSLPENHPMIAVYDSGVPFPQEVRDAWGLRRLSTHYEEGGSGIGMETMHNLCQKYSADFRIEEYPPNMPYTKCISVTFPLIESQSNSPAPNP